jgi:tetratricopeptide (TPR) repeat protein
MLSATMDPGRRARFHGARAAIPALALGLSFAAIEGASAAGPPKPSSTTAPAASAAATAAPAASSAPTAAQTAAAATTSDAAKDKRARQARAVELHDEAKVLYERGLYRRAIAKLEAAIELDPEGKELVYNLALIHEKLAEADVAEGYYLRYIQMETDPKARERALAIVKRLHGAQKNLEADIQERAIASTTSAGSSAPAARVDAAVPVSRTPSPMVFVIGGVAVAAVGVGIGFGVSALMTNPGSATTGPDLTAYDLETRARSAHTQAVIADLAFVTSLVVGAAATVLYLVESHGGRGAPAATPSSPAAAPSSPRATSAGPSRAPSSSPPRTGAAALRVEAPF